MNSGEGRKMKKTIFLNLLILLLLWPPQLKAAPTTAIQAEKAVRGWLKVDMQPLGMSLGQQVMNVETFSDTNGQPIYYVVYLWPSGFVIVPADDLVEPIVAFADDGIYDPSPDNPLGTLVSQDLSGRIAVVGGLQKTADGQSQKKDLASQRATFERTSVKAHGKWTELHDHANMSTMQALGLSGISDVRVVPLVQSKWNQGSECGYYCYNYYTPNHYYCGCVATAFAQLIRFHEYPTAGIGVHSFTIKVDGVSQTAYTRGGNGAGGPYSWNFMVLDPRSCNNYTNDRWKAIGALCYDVGVAARAEYASGGTNTDQIRAAEALRTTFLYSNAICTHYWPEIIGAELIKMLNPNLDASLPALLSITSGTSGHSVVCDGYGYNGSTLYHHINMGNSGIDDAWYNLPDIGIYDTVVACTYNVFKQDSGEIISGRVVNSNGNPIGEALVTAQGPGGPYTTTTNIKGIYALIGVSSDSTYSVSVTKTGYEFTSQNVTVGTSQNGASVSGNLWGINFQDTALKLYVDDDSPGDPGPGNPAISDPCENGSILHPYDSIQEAIDNAENGITIIVQEGTYTGLGNRDINFRGLGITVRSTNPNNLNVVAATIIDCNGSEPEPYRGFYFHNFETSNSILDGLTITNGYTSGNWPEDSGGAIICYYASPIIRNCIVTNNTAVHHGGGIYNYYSNPMVINCTFSWNSAGWNGGGLHNGPSSPNLTNCLFIENSASSYGGGISNSSNSNPILTNCTISRNSAYRGGAIESYNSNVILTNCILWGDNPDELHVTGTIPSLSYCDVQGGWIGTGNIGVDPLFMDVANGDYHLRSQAGRWEAASKMWVQDEVSSPCIDAGDPGSDWTAELWPHGKQINMGALGGMSQASMYSSDAGNIADLSNNGSVDYTDLMMFTNKWLYQEVLLPEDLNRNRFVNGIDFAIFANNWLWQE